MPSNQREQSPAPTVAIVGSGPSGCYTAQFLRKDLPDAEITVFEALPVPYGLVRYGVAADHQGTKAVAAQFDRLFSRSHVSFVGNTRIGADLSVEELTEAFDVVVVATGLSSDRQLSVTQDESARIVGAGRILRALNAFPHEAQPSVAPLTESLGEELIVVGHGNVALDVVRLLTKHTSHLTGSDIHDEALDLLRPTAPKTVHIVGRSAADNAKFDLAMLRELCAMEHLRIAVEGLDDTSSGAVADLLTSSVSSSVREHELDAEATRVTFHFRTMPEAVRAEDGRTVLDVIGPTGTPASYTADTVITAIGFCHNDDVEEAISPDTWSGSHVYRVGWCERGGRGNIAENRKHAQQTAKVIATELNEGRLPYGHRGGLQTVLPKLGNATVGFAGWQAIDEAERGAADAQRCRRKITDLDHMLTIAQAVNADT